MPLRIALSIFFAASSIACVVASIYSFKRINNLPYYYEQQDARRQGWAWAILSWGFILALILLNFGGTN